MRFSNTTAFKFRKCPPVECERLIATVRRSERIHYSKIQKNRGLNKTEKILLERSYMEIIQHDGMVNNKKDSRSKNLSAFLNTIPQKKRFQCHPKPLFFHSFIRCRDHKIFFSSHCFRIKISLENKKTHSRCLKFDKKRFLEEILTNFRLLWVAISIKGNFYTRHCRSEEKKVMFCEAKA